MNSPYDTGEPSLRQPCIDPGSVGEQGAIDVHIVVVEGRTPGRLAMVCTCGWRSRLGDPDAAMDDAFLHSIHVQDSGNEVWLLAAESIS